MTKGEAKVLFEYYDTLVKQLMEAKLALVSGGVKSYTIDNRSLTRFDIDSLGVEIEDAVKKRDIYRSIMNGGKPRKAFAILPRDF